MVPGRSGGVPTAPKPKQVLVLVLFSTHGTAQSPLALQTAEFVQCFCSSSFARHKDFLFQSEG